MIVIGIDASNIKAGGGFTHLSELIANCNYAKRKLVLFSGTAVLEKIPDHPALLKSNHPWLNKGSFYNMLWRLFKLTSAAKKHGVNIMFTPGGNYLPCKPYVSMSQNMLVFESKERNRFPGFLDRLRYIILEFKQVLSFKHAAGIIFISKYAGNFIREKYPFINKKFSATVYHGVADRFTSHSNSVAGRIFTDSNPFRLLYVSIINFYKHQDKLIEAVVKLKKNGEHIELNLVGPINPKIKPRFDSLLADAGDCIKYHGKISYEQIHSYYRDCDLFVFASTCENMPNILVEAMKAKLPILCSNYGPMPEVLKDGGLYVDPTNVQDLCDKILALKASEELRRMLAKKAGDLASSYTWYQCAEETFSFIEDCLEKIKVQN